MGDTKFASFLAGIREGLKSKDVTVQQEAAEELRERVAQITRGKTHSNALDRRVDVSRGY